MLIGDAPEVHSPPDVVELGSSCALKRIT